MNAKHVGFFGFTDHFMEHVVLKSDIHPDFIIYLDLIIKIQILIFIGTIIALLYTIFKNSKMGYNIRKLYTFNLQYDDNINPIRQAVAIVLLYYFILIYCILYPKLVVYGIYYPGKLAITDLFYYIRECIKFILYKMIS